METRRNSARVMEGELLSNFKILTLAQLGRDSLVKIPPGNSFNTRPPEEDSAAWKERFLDLIKK